MGKKVSVSVSKDLASKKSLGFVKFGLGKKSLGFGTGESGLGKNVSVLVLENLVSEKMSRFWFRRIWSRKKVSVSVS